MTKPAAGADFYGKEILRQKLVVLPPPSISSKIDEGGGKTTWLARILEIYYEQNICNFSIFGCAWKGYIFSTRLKIPTKFQFRYVNLYQKTRKHFFSIFNIYFLSRDSARFRFVNMIIIILKNAFIFARTFRINFWKWISVLDFPIPI